MAYLKDTARVVNGLSLVSKEAISRSQTAPLESVIKGAVLSATDAAGLTKGKLLTLDSQAPKIQTTIAVDGNAGSNIVYFRDKSVPQTLDVDATAPLPAPSTLDASVDDTVLQISSDEGPRTCALSTSSATVADGTVAPRNPREKRVPSTSFSGAIG